MRPYVICYMLTSLDGSLHPSRFTLSPDGTRADWSKVYEQVHKELDGDAWIVGRVTMAEISKVGPHVSVPLGPVERRCHIARHDVGSYAVALDPSGKVHFSRGDLDGDHVVVMLGRDVPDSHLAELAADGVSYIVSETAEIDLATMLDRLGRDFHIRRLLLDGGARINGSFLAAGVVDELHLLVAPALDARPSYEGFVAFNDSDRPDAVRLSFTSCEPLENGMLHLRYAVVTPPANA
ncbi:MAG: RibD family protein [Acetobacter papayae]|uniref:RibD family protein n=1 Tax=Acetobacter papayae TaxID=1076592 RepID=UPI0039E835DF